MFLKQLDLTTALRPSYLPDEDLLFVQDNVGLYEGKYKILNQQNGQIYLTSHRVCYVDQADPRKYSAALDLKDVERYDFYAGFLKSSPKITLFPKPARRPARHTRASSSASAARSHAGSPLAASAGSGGGAISVSTNNTERDHHPAPVAAATWVCTICSFANPVPANFDPETLNAHTPLPPCLACGIQPTLAHVLKAVIARAARAQPETYGALPGTAATNAQTTLSPLPYRPAHEPPTATTPSTDPDASFQCPRCTFLNHPSLMACEICGAPLVSHDLPAALTQPPHLRTESPGPVVVAAGGGTNNTNGSDESVKLSFRGGGEKIFYERLKGAIAQRKWLLHNAPPIPSLSRGASVHNSRGAMDADTTGSTLSLTGTSGSSGASQPRAAGIAGLERRGLDMRKNNELVIGSAFEDLEALMASAKQIVALAETLARQTGAASAAAGSSTNTAGSDAHRLLAETATSQLGLVTTKDIVGGGGGSGRESLYLSELSRNLVEFLTDDARGVLRRAGGIMSLVDLWAVFNRARGGVELVSPMDLLKAAQLWAPLGLPVRLRTFKRSGVLVVQGRDRTDETTVQALLGWLRTLRVQQQVGAEDAAPFPSPTWTSMFGRGVSAQEVAERFGWSIGVAEEELEMAEERGALCREESIAGLIFWENFITA
ncbi:vacuolar protein sorting protein [Niveomyces insectorum RCEF 264]|uniref:Vacuolar protein-sorting-associated protein 36 n=1 Tax=Niveomyces insectorum RCEF 264 TaxID=1081102 RepID=A0A167PV95_9HYPO|nr:vacuolar protein sorting protein [Niveomyces insectorum RCEF 264]